jgi:hypothetical protein
MKFHLATISLIGSMMTMGCAGTTRCAADPSGAAALSSAELRGQELDENPYWPMLADNPYGPVEEPAPTTKDDPWARKVTAPPAAQTWGASPSMDVDYGF